jgi:hypothetical protein
MSISAIGLIIDAGERSWRDNVNKQAISVFIKLAMSVLLICISSSRYALAQSPSITGISPSTGVVGSQVEITGNGFGASQGSSTISLNGISVIATTWSDGAISAIVPSGGVSAQFSVTVGGQAAYTSSFTVLSAWWLDRY